MPPFPLPFPFFGVLLALLLGCAGFGVDLEPPEVTLIGMNPLEGGALEQRFEVELRILNPNPQALEIDGMEFTLAINGRRLARGVGNERTTIPRLGEGVVRVTASTTLLDWVRQIAGAASAASLRYELDGRVFLDGSFRGLPFAHKGELLAPRGAR